MESVNNHLTINKEQKSDPELLNRCRMESEKCILDIIDRYMKFLDLWEDVRESQLKDGKQDLVEDILGIKFSDTKNFIDNQLVVFAEIINKMIGQEKFAVIHNNSFVDTVNNSTLTWIGGTTKIIKEIESGNIKKRSDLRPLWIQYADGLKESFTTIPLYLENLCGDREKLKMELLNKYGYLEKFKKYFNKLEAMSGSRKIPYFMFFSKLESGQIVPANIDRELVVLDGEIINKKIIKADMKLQ